jgi:ribosomal protein S18 acetylase RimI-like enzyme
MLVAASFSIIAMEKGTTTDTKNRNNIVLQKKTDFQKNELEFILLENNKRAGYVLFSVYGSIGRIDWIGVEDKFLRKGYVRLLLQNACKELYDLVCETVSLIVMFAESSIPAVNLYRSEGFEGDPNDKMVLDLKQWWSPNNK